MVIIGAMPAPTILLVEDDDDLRRLFRTALRMEGLRVLEAADGLTALRLLDKEPPPDLVVLDLLLPLVSGAMVRAELSSQATLRDVPVIVVTGQPGSHAHLNVARVFHKPLAPDDLVRAVLARLN